MANYWNAGTVLEYVTWQGEINGRETDMPGTYDDPCCFENCSYTLSDGQGSQNALFDNALPTDTLDVTHQRGNRPDEWGISFAPNTNSFCIWDDFPF